MREALGLSFSQSQAINAPNMGTVALRIDDRPVVIDSRANAKHANGMPELSIPTRNIFRQCVLNSGSRPRSQTSGSRNRAAIVTRTAAVGSGPNSTVPMRMNKNDEPQMAASKTKSVSQLFGLASPAVTAAEALEALEFKPAFPQARLPALAMRPCAQARRHNP